MKLDKSRTTVRKCCGCVNKFHIGIELITSGLRCLTIELVNVSFKSLNKFIKQMP